MHKKSAHIVQRSFEGDASFVAGLDRACTEFVNQNAVTAISTSKSTELLAMHAEALLRQNNKLAEENAFDDRALEGVVSNSLASFFFVSSSWFEVLRLLFFSFLDAHLQVHRG